MKNLLLKLERFVPFLSLPRLSLPGRGAGIRLRRVPAERLQAGVALSNVELNRSTVRDGKLEAMQLHEVGLRGLSFESTDLSGTTFSHCALDDCRTVSSSLDRTQWRIVSADRSAWTTCTFEKASWVGVSFREASFDGCDLSGAEILMSDGFAARLHGVRAVGICLRAADLSYANLDDVDLTDADLRGCRLVRGTWHRVVLDGALLDGADLRGVRGLSRETRLELLQRGALVWSGWIERAVWAAVSRFLSQGSYDRIERVVRSVTLGIRALLTVLVLGLVGLGLRGGCLSPPPHDEGLASSTGAAWVKRTATQEEIDRTKENLARLRKAIARAYQTTAKYGIARYPTGAEVASNRFDKDGDGPGTETVELVPGGLPQNFLTDGEGVAPYCNEVPTQETLSGDNTDWHYCDTTGRVFACGGFTDLPTLEW